MSNPEEAPEEAKKITVRPRRFEAKEDEPVQMPDPEPAPRAADPVPEPSLTTAPEIRKRPSPALRPADSAVAESNGVAVSSSPVAMPPEAGQDTSEWRRSSRGKRSKGGLKTPLPLGVALVLAIVMTVVSGFFFYSAGTRAGFDEAESAAVKEQVELTPEFLDRLDTALSQLQGGNATAALEELQALEKDQPDVATISLLIANAALLADDPGTAQERIAQSIRRRESVSDALTLQAIVEAKLATDSEHKRMGSPKLRIEQLLRQAIAADSANPRPYFELATLKRFEGRFDEAEDLLLSSQCRINAADSRMVTDTALALVRLQKASDADLRIPENPAPTPESLFPAAYSAMRLGDSARAAQLLETVRGILPENVFRQILKDPAFLPYTKEAALEGFFQNPGQPEKK
jgi:hypothetical protein